MGKLEDLSVWQNRWLSLNAAMNQLIKRLEEHNQALSLDRKTTLLCLVKRLQAFANSQFNFFYDGFGSQKLELSAEYPPEYVLWITLEQVAYDLEVIQRIANQRILGSSEIQKEMQEMLKITDKITLDALLPAIKCGMVAQGTKVITYFQKSASIRCIPYAPVALIAIPFTCIQTPRDLLAIPHECGHYVFWHGFTTGEEPKPIWRELVPEGSQDPQESQDPPPYYHRWIEEIFADVYGCLIAGPAIALDFQDLSRARSVKEFLEDDGEHPTPILRPHIYTTVLKERQDSKQWADNLESHWDTRIGEWQAQVRGELPGEEIDFGKIHVQGKPEPIFLSKAREDTTAAMTKVLALLPSSIQQGWWREYILNISTPGEPEPLRPYLYTAFNQSVRNLKENAESPDELVEIQDDTAQLWENWVKKEKFFDGNLPPCKESISKDNWINVLSAAGWTTKGPTGDPRIKSRPK